MNEVGRGCERCFRGLGIVGSWVPLGPFWKRRKYSLSNWLVRRVGLVWGRPLIGLFGMLTSW